MGIISDTELRFPSMFRLPRGAEPLNQRMASEIEKALMGRFKKKEVVMMFANEQEREIIIHFFLERLLYAFRTEQLKSNPSFKGLKSWELATLDETVIYKANRAFGFKPSYNADRIVEKILEAYQTEGYTIRES